MGITIREASTEDSSAIAAILHALGWSNYSQNTSVAQSQADIAEFLADFQREPKHTTVLVAEAEQPIGNAADNAEGDAYAESTHRVIGYVSVHWYPHLMRGENDGYISELFVHPASTGQGAGTQLLQRVKELARQRGCTRLLLLNRRIRESYSRRFYEKHGWKEQGDMAFFSYSLTPATSSSKH